MPSYLEREQYERVQPHIDNIQAILNTYQTKLGLYGQGTGYVKNMQDNLLKLGLTLDTNKARLSAGMQLADSSLKTFLKSDMSAMSNVKSALGVFDPIVKDQDIMSDHAFTENTDAQLATADSQRLVDGGKNYNQASVDYIKGLKNLFKQTEDPKFAKTLLAMDPKYSEYYDTTAEMKKLKDMYETDKTDITSASGGYLIRDKDQSWQKEKWQAFVEANASPQLKNQLGIEAKAQYIQQLLYTPAADLQKRYQQQFDTMHKQALDNQKDKLNEHTLKMQGLDKKANNYNALKLQYDKAIQTFKDNIKSLSDPTNPDNHLPQGLGDYKQLPTSTMYAESLYKHAYFDKIGSAFAHTDYTHELKFDAAFAARERLNLGYKQLTEDHNQFTAEQDFKYFKQAQDYDMAGKRLELDAYNALLKWDAATRKYVPIPGAGGTPYAIPGSDATGKTTDEEIGKEVVDGRQRVINSNGLDAAETVAKSYLGTGSLTDILNNTQYTFNHDAAGNETTEKTFAEVTLPGGGGQLAKQTLLKNLADMYYGSEVYKLAGIDESDPDRAKAEFIKTMNAGRASNIMSMFNTGLNTPKVRDLYLESMKDKPGGSKAVSDLLIINQERDSAIKMFDQVHGQDVSKVLKEMGYPEHVDPTKNKALWDMGIRGYMDGDAATGSYRVPTEKEIRKFFTDYKDYFYGNPVNDRNIITGAKAAWSTIKGILTNVGTAAISGLPTPTSGSNLTMTGPLEGLKNSEANNAMEQIYKTIGAKAKVTANFLEQPNVINEKNKAGVLNRVTSYTQMSDNKGDKSAEAYNSLISRNLQAVTGLYEQGSISGQTTTFRVTLDPSKLQDDDKKVLKDLGDYTKLRLRTTSELFPKTLKNGTPGFLTSANVPEEYSVPYKTMQTPGYFYKENQALPDQPPQFAAKMNFWFPDMSNGILLTPKMITEDNIGEIIGPNWRAMMQQDPTTVSTKIKRIMNWSKETIDFMNQNKLSTYSEVPPEKRLQLKEILQD